MKLQCPDSACLAENTSPTLRPFVRKGFYYRKSDGQWIQKYRCLSCGKYFSSSLLSPCYRQKRRNLNHRIFTLLNSGISQRRLAHVLRTNRKTIVRKFRFLSQQAHLEHQSWLKKQSRKPLLTQVQFDDLETAEHTKCKPLSVALAIEPKSRKILSIQVSQMPAKGHLTQLAFKKYGPRRDERSQGWNSLFESLKPIVNPQAVFRSDENPHYPRHLKKYFPNATHEQMPGRKPSIAGQGELKKVIFDPLFSLNHTCAMLRANLNRLFRKTWCTTKTRQGLIDHLALYVVYHNRSLTPLGDG